MISRDYSTLIEWHSNGEKTELYDANFDLYFDGKKDYVVVYPKCVSLNRAQIQLVNRLYNFVKAPTTTYETICDIKEFTRLNISKNEVLKNSGKNILQRIETSNEIARGLIYAIPPILATGIAIAINPALAPISIGLTSGAFADIALYGVERSNCIISRVHEFSQHPEYKKWASIRDEIKSANFCQQFLAEDNFLKHFLCPITKKLPLIPVRVVSHDPNINESTFDCLALLKAIANNTKDAPFAANFSDIKFDSEYVLTVLERLAVIQQQLKAKKISLLCLALGLPKKRDVFAESNDPLSYKDLLWNLNFPRSPEYNEYVNKFFNVVEILIQNQYIKISDFPQLQTRCKGIHRMLHYVMQSKRTLKFVAKNCDPEFPTKHNPQITQKLVLVKQITPSVFWYVNGTGTISQTAKKISQKIHYNAIYLDFDYVDHNSIAITKTKFLWEPAQKHAMKEAVFNVLKNLPKIVPEKRIVF